jgi:hypothetical protein
MLWNWPTLQPDLGSAQAKTFPRERFRHRSRLNPIERRTRCSLDSEFDDGGASVTWQ